MHHLGGVNPGRARLIVRHKRENLFHKPVVCNQCANAFCMTACPAGAIIRNRAGVVIIDSDQCVGCGLCTKYCPEHLVAMDPDTGKAVKCDLCGKDPECVKACPTGALELIIPGGDHDK